MTRVRRPRLDVRRAGAALGSQPTSNGRVGAVVGRAPVAVRLPAPVSTAGPDGEAAVRVRRRAGSVGGLEGRRAGNRRAAAVASRRCRCLGVRGTPYRGRGSTQPSVRAGAPRPPLDGPLEHPGRSPRADEVSPRSKTARAGRPAGRADVAHVAEPRPGGRGTAVDRRRLSRTRPSTEPTAGWRRCVPTRCRRTTVRSAGFGPETGGDRAPSGPTGRARCIEQG